MFCALEETDRNANGDTDPLAIYPCTFSAVLGALAPSDRCFRSIAGAQLGQYFCHVMLDCFLLQVQTAPNMLV